MPYIYVSFLKKSDGSVEALTTETGPYCNRPGCLNDYIKIDVEKIDLKELLHEAFKMGIKHARKDGSLK